MRVLLTGSEGSLGQALIPKLIGKGYEVTGIDNLARYGKRPGHAKCKYEFIQADLIDSNICHTLVYKHDVVIHAAAMIFGVGGFHKYCADILGKDVTLITNMLRASCDHNVKRFVYISSSMVYEKCETSEEFLLDSPEVYKIPVTDYGLSKYMGERLCKAYWKQYQLPYTIWRPFNILNPYEKAGHEIGESHVFADFIDKIVYKKLETIPIIGNGQQIRCFTDVDDIANCIADYSLSETTKNEHFNLGRVEPVKMIDLAEKIREIAYGKNLIETQKLKFETIRKYNDDVKKRIPSVGKAQMFFGWKAKTNLRESLNKCF